MAGETIIAGEGFREPEMHKAFETAMGGSGVEAVAGVVALVMGLRGLFGAAPGAMAAIGIMVIGIGLIIQGMSIAVRYEELLKALDSGERGRPAADLAGGMTVEFIGGLTGIVLGVLALLGFAPIAMMSAALIAFGITLLMSTAETSRLISMGSLEGGRARQVFRVAVPVATGWQVLVGLVAMILGILAVVILSPALSMTLILSGVTAVGVALLFSGSAVASRLMLLLKH